MADCLACSGCVTTAETVLMEQNHSLQSLRKRLQQQPSSWRSSTFTSSHQRHLRVLSISPNSFADLCRHWKVPATSTTFAKLTTLLYNTLQADLVVDGNVPLQWTWQDEAEEFVQAFQQQQQQPSNNNLSSPSPLPSTPYPSIPIDQERTLVYQLDNGTTKVEYNHRDLPPITNLPLISGSCPALVLLLEKGSAEYAKLVPQLSRTVSPMTRLGMALKQPPPLPPVQEKSTHLQDVENELNCNGDSTTTTTTTIPAPSATTTANTISWEYWAIMPCHDKKLEASRKDFLLVGGTSSGIQKDDNNETMAVDMVITSSELVELVEELYGCHFSTGQGHDVANATPPTPKSMAQILEELSPAFICYSESSQITDISNVCPQVTQVHAASTGTNTRTTSDTCPAILLTIKEEHSTDADDQMEIDTSNNNSSKNAIPQKNMAFASGGHAHYIFRYAALKLFGQTLDDKDLHWEPLTIKPSASGMASSLATTSNSDSTTTTVIRSARLARQQKKQQAYQLCLYQNLLKDGGTFSTKRPPVSNGDGDYKVVLRFEIAHGMQNMQRALKRIQHQQQLQGADTTNSPIHYLEAMACPHGCVNGGGSVRLPTTLSSSSSSSSSTKKNSSVIMIRETPTETALRVSETLRHLTVPTSSPSSSSIYPDQNMIPKKNYDFYQTRYHVVPPMHHTMGAAAGVKVTDMQW